MVDRIHSVDDLRSACTLRLTEDRDQIGDVAIARTYEPNPAHRALYDELFAAFEAIYKQNNAIYRRLNRG